SDDEREKLTRLCMKKIDGRVKTIVTVSHFATDIVRPRAKLAKSLGADIIMMMPPYHGALLKGNPDQIFEQFNEISEVGIPIMIQDAPLSGIDLSVPLLTKMINEIENLTCFKIESAQAASKIRALINNCSERLDAPFDGEESITLYADLEAGISGSMSSALLPEKIAPIIDHFWNNEKDKAEQVYNNILPLINFENRQCGFRATKTVMKEGGVIKSDFCRDPIKPLDPDTKKLLLNFAKKYDLLTYKWGK
ncbi:dihydrodipicolinate synthase family protein, partial [Pelagibacteraceae bacterium]|nr:dihydrodipicolinate synthase family protein [Pelagibacteraceae bacterium]